jgi:hypothetical protein
MAINPYFNFLNASNEQDLYESMIIESIRIFGMNTYYMPKNMRDFDEIFREATVNEFNQAFTVEMYLKTNLGFQGDGKFMSRELGFEIRDEMVMTVAKSVFTTITGFDRPREGDLVYFPLDKKVYEIKYVEHQAIFYQLGKLQTYDLVLELLEYTGQQFNTGVPEIDAIDTSFKMDGLEDDQIEDWIDQSSEIQTDAAPLIEFDPNNPFGGPV